MKTKIRKKIKAYIELILSLVFIISGVYFCYIQYNENQKYDTRVDAVGKSVEDKYDRKNNKHKYKAKCEYEVHGKPYSYVTDWSSHHYTKNDIISINIDSADPEKINKYGHGTLGAFLIFCGGFAFYFYKRE